MPNVIYTEKNECQECCKCVRNCPVKAIKIINHSAQIDYSRCIACGTCVSVCPAGAQRVRNDTGRLKILLNLKDRVILSLAPSFVAEFDDLDLLFAKIKKAGFFAVSETALGADIVTYFQRKHILSDNKTMFSTACPVVVDYIQKYKPEYEKYLSPYLSPLLTHSLFLKKYYGDDIGIVFAGPCIAKKKESDLYPEYLDIALTFDELKEFLNEIEVDSNNVPNIEFKPCKSFSGVVYPIEGGMLQTLSEYDKKDVSVVDRNYFNLSGLKEIMDLLEEENFDSADFSVFCEFLACEGGCINGSALSKSGNILSRKERVINYYKERKNDSSVKNFDFSTLNFTPLYDKKFSDRVEKYNFSDEEINRVLNKIGKFSQKDLLDCGGCGYNTCKEFAEACLAGLAEYDMCVINMKRLAQNKLNKLIKVLPLGVVIVDINKNIVECNAEFINMFINVEADERMIQRLKGKSIVKFVGVDNIIDLTFKQNGFKTSIRCGEKVFESYSFIIDKEMIGIIFQDVTKVAVKRETIVKKAEEVIKKNLQVVQKIAFLLGENAAESEVILNSLIEAINISGDDDGKDNRS